MNSSIVELEINGKLFTGWKSFSCEFDMEALSSAFSFELFDKGNVLQGEFKTGFAAKVYISPAKNSLFRDLVIDGFVTKIDRSMSGTSTTMTIAGNDKLIDLVDCSALHKSQTWVNKKFSAIVKDILSPFALDVDTFALNDDPQIEKFTLQSGESAFNAVERLCRSQAVLPLSTFLGVLQLGYAATEAERTIANLEVGKNIKNFSESSSWQERFSKYYGRAQTTGNGKKWTKAMLQCAAEAEDLGVTRYRPLLFVSENKADNKLLDKRVKWEAQVRSGRALEHTVTTDGFYQKGKNREALTLWTKNKRVNLRNPYWDIDIERLITKVAFSMTQSGEITTLTLKHPDIFKPDPTEKVELA